jgi:hypothetical protein
MIARFNTASSALAFAHKHRSEEYKVILGRTGVYWVVNPGAAKFLIGYDFEEITHA